MYDYNNKNNRKQLKESFNIESELAFPYNKSVIYNPKKMIPAPKRMALFLPL